MKNTILFCVIGFLFSCTDDRSKMFSKISAGDTGIKFKNILKETEELNVMNYGYFYNGGGIAVGDINNDGLPDLYFTGNLVASRLYLNQGSFEFDEIAENAGVLAAGVWNTGVTMADVNADGFLDIYVCRSATTDPEKRRNQLFINNGDLTFTERGYEFGLDDSGYSTQASFFDYDRDGDLDMFLLNHSVQEYAGFSRLLSKYKNRVNIDWGDKLFRNDSIVFNNVTLQSGIKNNILGFGLGVTVSDVNQDGWPDIYVANDYNEEDYFYINQKNGLFKESLAEYFGHVSLFSMGCDGADINNDLLPDIVTLDMMPESNYRQKMSLGPENYEKYNQLIRSGFHHQTMRNMLQLNNGNGPFSEIGQLAGISTTDWSWAPLVADYDNDGWKDLFVTNGYMRNYLDMDFMNYAVSEKIKSNNGANLVVNEFIEKMPSIHQENSIFKNNGDLTFAKRNEEWGLDQKTISNGAVYADLDNDGDLDIVTNNVNEPAHVYRNNSETITSNSYLKIRLKGKGKNTFGVGTKIIVYADNKSMLQELFPARGFQSSVDYELLFGLGQSSQADSIKITWPDSSFQKFYKIPANQILTLSQQEASSPGSKSDLLTYSAFAEQKDNLGISYVHKENDYFDFKADKLLPYGISNSGPKAATGDINNDGLDDIYVGGAKGSAGQLYIQKVSVGFSEWQDKIVENDSLYEDTNAIFFDADGDKDLDLYVTSGGVDFEAQSPYLQDRLYINNGRGNFTKSSGLPEMTTSTSSITVSDIDDDSDLDVFAGGRLIPGEYPSSPRSYILINDGQGTFEDKTTILSKELTSPGMITDAAFINIDGDEYSDLVLVGDWMKVSIFLNKEGRGFDLLESESLSQTQGWWNTIHANDFDNDGDIDLVLGNFGLNNLYQPTPEQPVSMVYKDFDSNGSIDPLLFYYIQEENEFAYSRDELLGQINHLKKRFPDYETFAKSSAQEILTKEESENADTLRAMMLQSAYFQNDSKGDFTVKELPVQAQFSPIYAIQSLDINRDGNLDIITGGNQSLTRVSTGRYDANYGVTLLGDGKGGFTSLKPTYSGLKIKGDVRDISLLIGDDKYVLFFINNDSVQTYMLLDK